MNLHFHSVAIDGVFSVAGPTPVFHQLRGPTDEELADDPLPITHLTNTAISSIDKQCGRFSGQKRLIRILTGFRPLSSRSSDLGLSQSSVMVCRQYGS